MERRKVVRGAQMIGPDKNLRHRGKAVGAFHHLGAPVRCARNVDFGEFDALAAKQCLGGNAVTTIRSRVNHNRRHSLSTLPYIVSYYMGIRAAATTRAKTSTSTLRAPARSRTRVHASTVAPDVSTSSTRTSRLP